jgi:hypothetical protein
MKLTIARLKSLIREEFSRMDDTHIVNSDSGLGYDSQKGEIDAENLNMSQIDAKATALSIEIGGAEVTVMNVSQEAYDAFDQERTIDDLNPIQQDDGLYTLHF